MSTRPKHRGAPSQQTVSSAACSVHEFARGSRVAPAVYTVPEFCSSHRISRALFYIMAREGRGPAIIKAGRRTLVSKEAAEQWRARMEAA